MIGWQKDKKQIFIRFIAFFMAQVFFMTSLGYAGPDSNNNLRIPIGQSKARFEIALDRIEDDKNAFYFIENDAQFIKDMDPDDRHMMIQLINSTTEEQERLINESSGRVYKAFEEQGDLNEGRTLFLELTKPVSVGGKSISLLALKGIRLKLDEKGQVNSYTGNGFARRSLTVDANGDIVVVSGEPGPKGGIEEYKAEWEYRMMNELDKIFGADHPVGLGCYRQKEYQGKQLGFVIFGMEGPSEIRIAFDDSRQGPRLIPYNRKTGNGVPFDENLLAKKIGRRIRDEHDAGYYHLMAHYTNIAVKITQSEADIIFKDRTTTIKNNGELSQKQQVAYRFLDLARLIYELFSVQSMVFDEETGAFTQIDATRLARPLLEGYFYNMDFASDEFLDMVSMAQDMLFAVTTSSWLSEGNINKIQLEELFEAQFFSTILKNLSLIVDAKPSTVGLATLANQLTKRENFLITGTLEASQVSRQSI